MGQRGHTAVGTAIVSWKVELGWISIGKSHHGHNDIAKPCLRRLTAASVKMMFADVCSIAVNCKTLKPYTLHLKYLPWPKMFSSCFQNHKKYKKSQLQIARSARKKYQYRNLRSTEDLWIGSNTNGPRIIRFFTGPADRSFAPPGIYAAMESKNGFSNTLFLCKVYI